MPPTTKKLLEGLVGVNVLVLIGVNELSEASEHSNSLSLGELSATIECSQPNVTYK